MKDRGPVTKHAFHGKSSMTLIVESSATDSQVGEIVASHCIYGASTGLHKSTAAISLSNGYVSSSEQQGFAIVDDEKMVASGRLEALAFQR